MKLNCAILSSLLVAGLAPQASAQAFADNFDIEATSLGLWGVKFTPDTAATFAYDYSADGIPSAPNSIGGTTLGLKFEANITAASAAAVSAIPNMDFTGPFTMSFDMWMNVNGPLPAGGGGSTEFFTAGVGASGGNVVWTSSGEGAWFAVSGEGGSSRDYRGYKGGSEQFAESGQFAAGTSSGTPNAHNSADPYYTSAFPGQSVPAGQDDGGPQTGTAADGTVAFAWREVVITRSGDTVSWSIDGLPIATLDANIGDSFDADGAVFVGYMDIFSSLSDSPEHSFGLVDNFAVTPVPEPTTYAAIFAGGLLAFAAVRRRMQRQAVA